MAVGTIQEAAIDDYLAAELRCRERAVECHRIGELALAANWLLRADIAHRAAVNEAKDEPPRGLGSFEPTDRDTREGR